MQKVLFDRRVVLSILDKIGVPTPRRVLVNRDSPEFDLDVIEKVKRNIGMDIRTIGTKTQNIEQIDHDILIVDGIQMVKPFVEKPVSGEDHNIYIYYHSNQGGGCRKLFRKVPKSN
jgi:hypothetical protein